MPRALSHAVVLTGDLDATLRFLGDIAQVAPVSEVSEGAPEDYSLVFGWPLDQAAAPRSQKWWRAGSRSS